MPIATKHLHLTQLPPTGLNAEALFTPRPQPSIYAYTTPQYAQQAWQGKRTGQGLLKIGYTTRPVEDRIKEQLANVVQPTAFDITTVLKVKQKAITHSGQTFSDALVHQHLEALGYHRIRNEQGQLSEWFECTVEELKAVLTTIITGQQQDTQQRTHTFGLRPEQHHAVEQTQAYFNKHSKARLGKAPHFLWNAKMRFGKTFATYQLAKAMGWQRVLVLTYKPAVQDAWQSDLETHVDFNGWQFINEKTTIRTVDDADPSKPWVCFTSLQNLQRDKHGNIKPKLQSLYATAWDCIVLDEYHFGAWRDTAKDEYDQEFSDDKPFNEASCPLQTNHFLYLSGTPFRAISNGEFMEDQIFNWTYPDEQRAKARWHEDYPHDPINPYAMLPRMVLMTYKLPDHLRQHALATGDNEFSLNEFFKAKEESTTHGSVWRFEHENQVQKWLNLLRGGELIRSGSSDENTHPPLPYEDAKLLGLLNHTLWYLPSVGSCKAMKALLEKPQNTFYHDYVVLDASGNEAGMGVDALRPVQEAIRASESGKDKTGLHTKTITLSCGKLTTGVSVPQWGGMLMLRDTTSPETYFQAAFRVQTPWVLSSPHSDESVILKHNCYVFDFSPNRALSLIAQYNSTLGLNESNRSEERIQEFLNFLPVLCYDGYSMTPLDAQTVLNILATGTGASMLAKRWQSPQLINIDTFVLEKLMDSQQLLLALEGIEGFRTLGKDVSKIISSTKELDKAKKERGDKALTPTEKKTQDEVKSKRKEIRDKLLKFITRIPVFMYLTDYREECLRDVITQLEPELFKKVTNLNVQDFEQLCELGIFPAHHLNAAIFTFKRFEEGSLIYIDSHKTLSPTERIGGFDTIIIRSERDELLRTAEG